MAKVTQAEIIKLYDVILDRTPDAKGFAYWEGQAKSMTLDKMAELFFGSKEFKEMTKDLKPEALAKEVEKLKADLKVDSPEMNARVAFVEALIAKDKKLLGTLAANKTLESVWEGTDINEAVDTLANASVGFDIATLYVTILGRLPDAGGYAWYKNKMEKEGWTLDRIAKDFLKSSEFKKLYKTPEDFANAVETNKIFGKLSKEQKADLVKMATEKSGGDFVGFLTDNFDTFKDKAALASTFLENGKSDEKAIEVFKKFLKDGKADVAKKTLGITDDAPKATFKDDFKADATVSLTKDADALPAKEGDNKGNDLFKGTASVFLNDNTLNSEDVIDGGAGNDRLLVDLKTDFGGFADGKGVKNVEEIYIKNADAAERSFNAKGVEKATAYILDGNVNLTNLDSIAKTTLVNRTADFSAAYDAAAVAGGEDKLELALHSVGKQGAAVKLDATGIETLSLNVAGANFINNNLADATSVVAEGKGSLNFTSATTNKLTSFDASKVSGKVVANLAGQTAIKSATLGNGNDKVVVDDTTAADVAIKGGAGRDTLVVNTAAVANVAYAAESVENLELGSIATGALTFDATNVSGLERVVATAGVAQDVTLSNLGAKNLTLNLKGVNANAKTITLDHTGSTLVVVNGEAGANTLKATLSESAKLNVAVAEGMDYQGVITAAKAASVGVTLKGKTSGTAEISAAEATALKINEVANASALKLTAAKATSLQVAAAADLDLTNSVLSKLETLTVDTEGKFTGVNLAALKKAVLDGKNAKGEAKGIIKLGNLGAATLENDIVVDAKNLADNGGTKALTLGTIDTKEKNISVTAKGIDGEVELGAIKTNPAAAKGGNVALDLDVKKATLGAITAGNTANVAIKAKETVSLQAITAKNLVLDLSEVVGAVTYSGALTVNESIVLSGSKKTAMDLSANGIVAAAGSKTLGVTVNGGEAVDQVKITGDAATTSIAIQGDLGAGADTVTVVSKNADLALDIAGLKGATSVEVQAVNSASQTLTLKGSDEDDTLTFAGDAASTTLTLKGDLGKGKDAVTVTSQNNAATAIDVSALKGAETINITLNTDTTNAETITIGKNVVTIANFKEDKDVLKLEGTGAGATQFQTNTSDNAAFDAGSKWKNVNVFTDDIGDNLDVATLFGKIQETAKTLTDAKKFYIVASNGTDAAVYLIDTAKSGVATAIEAGDITKVVTLTGIDTTEIANVTAAQFGMA